MRSNHSWRAVSFLLPWLLLVAAGAIHAASLTVGMEGRLEVQLPVPVEPKPVTEKATILLRVAHFRPHGTEYYYDFRYVGLEPGTYDLRDFLTRLDGESTASLPVLSVTIDGLLPPRHSGLLIPARKPDPSFAWRYRWWLAGAAAIWLIGWIAMAATRPRRKKISSAPALERSPNWADRLRPLIDAALKGDRQKQAELERTLLSFWSEKLQLDLLNPHESLCRMRDHPEAGELIRSLEKWLHQPPDRPTGNIEQILEPYQRTSPPAFSGEQNMEAR